MSEVHVLGIRHHGPGSARAVLAELDRFEPDLVLVEGPADADPLVRFAADPQLRPPVALLAYAADSPSRASFWPFSGFSPEWQALTWGARRGVEVRFMDLPAANLLALRADRAPSGHDTEDVLAGLAAAAGHDDTELWWEDVVEARSHDESPFPAITKAVLAVRSSLGTDADEETLLREAHMRKVLRAALRGDAERIAVVCGAWHAPALTQPLPPASADARVLRGIPRTKVTTTWIPWTHGRLATATGYGAGVTSPGWYAHLFAAEDQPVARWLTTVAHELRRRDLPASTAHVIEGVRLAETLAALRGRPTPGLAEVMAATRATICEGNDAVLDLVARHLVVGEALGTVPDTAPTVPLEADLTATCRRLRLRRDPVPATKDLDLRSATDAERSRLLHRLRILGIAWGEPAESLVRSTGTFRETWALAWRPEFAVDVVEASVWGTTVAAAATTRVISDALGASLPALTGLVEAALLADLDDALPDLVAALDARSARSEDIGHLMDALPPLVRALRYGDVRGTDTAALAHVADGLLVRICAGLPAAAASLDDAGSADLLARVDAVHASVGLRGDAPLADRWEGTLHSLLGRADVHGLLLGRFTRLLLDAGRITAPDAAARLERALSVGSPAPAKAAWVEGFLSGSGLLLVHDAGLLGILDEWLRGLTATDFTEIVPLVRRTFGRIEPGVRQHIGERVAGLTAGDRLTPLSYAASAAGPPWDRLRAAGAVGTVAELLGIRPLVDNGDPPCGAAT